MPIIRHSDYRPPAWLRNGHLQTATPSLLRRVAGVRYRRERIGTPDGDFLDLDWSRVGADRLAVVSHGLEGSSRRAYVKGMVRALNRGGWDALAWNFRSCSGEMNRRPRLYHSGATGDLDTVVRHALESGAYRRAALVGFSMGGNITLVYLGRRGRRVDPRIAAAVAFSVPCDLSDGARQLARPENRLYLRRFMRDLHAKVRSMAVRWPERVAADGLDSVRDFGAFDERYTAPLHGFAGAHDYWRRCSSRRFIGDVAVPALIVNAGDDPFLAGGCYPWEECRRSPSVYLETPSRGGHVGFVRCRGDGLYWSELRALAFLQTHGAGGGGSPGEGAADHRHPPSAGPESGRSAPMAAAGFRSGNAKGTCRSRCSPGPFHRWRGIRAP